MSIEPLALFIFIVACQTILIYCQAFSPFERECNWRGVLLGAKPAPRFWAVIALDLCIGLLLALLALSVWPHASGVWSGQDYANILPVWVLLNAWFAILHHLINNSLAHFPSPARMVRPLLAALLTGLIASLTLDYLLVQAATQANLRGVLTVLWQVGPDIGLPVFFLGLLVFIGSAFTFFLRAVPWIGSFLQAAASTGWLLAYLDRLGQISSQTLAASTRPGLHGLEGVALAISAAAVVSLVAAWRLPGAEAHPDGVEPPSLLCGDPQEAQVTVTQQEGAVELASPALKVQVRLSPFCLTIQNQAGKLLAELGEESFSRDFLLQRILSLPILYTGNTIKVKWRTWHQKITPAQGLNVMGSTLEVTLQQATLRVSFHTEDVLRLSVHISNSHWWNALSLVFPFARDIHWLGFGQRFNRIDQRGRELDCLVEEGGSGYAKLAPFLRHVWGERGTIPNGENCTSFPVPFTLAARELGDTTGWFWNTYLPSWFKSDPPAANNPTARLTVLDNRLDLFFCAGPRPLDVIRQYTGLTGRALVPPPWVLLPWKTRTGPVTESEVVEDIHKYRQLGIPLGQVGVENWQEVSGSYKFNPKTFPHIDQVIDDANRQGLHIQIWHFPYMNTGSATYRAGIRAGYFLRNRLGLPYHQRIFHGTAAVIDYSHPGAAQWHEDLVKQALYDRGFSGTMTDYGESIPPDCVFYNGKTGLEMRNAYPVMYCQSMQRAAQRSRGEDYLNYPRAGYAASQRFITAQFPGDQDTDWDDGDGLPAAVRAMLNVSMCGFPVHGSDIGGWFDVLTPFTTKELFIRWAEVGAFSPLMRAHGGIFGRNREPWKFDQQTVDIYRQLSQEHVRLFPYLYSLIVEASRTGKPPALHPALLWPDQAALYQVEDAWMLGEALYIAPVVRQGQTSREVILPPGEWWELNADRGVIGPARLWVDAPLGCTPRFLRRGYLLPRFAEPFDTFELETTGRSGHLADALEVWHYPGAQETGFTLFDGSQLHSENRSSQAGVHPVTWRLFQ